jgi:hypothetical protein
MLFRIPLVADARVSASIEIETDTLEAAQAEALKQANEGNASWHYDGVDDDTIELGDE